MAFEAQRCAIKVPAEQIRDQIRTCQDRLGSVDGCVTIEELRRETESLRRAMSDLAHMRLHRSNAELERRQTDMLERCRIRIVRAEEKREFVHAGNDATVQECLTWLRKIGA